VASKKSVNRISPGFWAKLPRPFFVLAPMANVTDSVFRRLFAKYGKPDVLWTEFVSADGLVSAGREKLLIDLEYSGKERPIVAQLFTGHPAVMKKSARMVADLKFDGLDLNMGCPDRAVEKQGGGAALMKDPKLAVEVIEAAREGIKESEKFTLLRTSPPEADRRFAGQEVQSEKLKLKVTKFRYIPVSVKTRLGYNKIDLEWIRRLLEQRLPALTIHMRTRKEMSNVPAHWEMMPEIVRLRNVLSPETLLIGNGDIDSLEEAFKICQKYGCDGAMIGRGAFGKPWFFRDADRLRKSLKSRPEPEPAEKLKVLAEHIKSFDRTFRDIKSFAIMKKHFKAYVNGWKGAKESRNKLYEAENAKKALKILKTCKSLGSD